MLLVDGSESGGRRSHAGGPCSSPFQERRSRQPRPLNRPAKQRCDGPNRDAEALGPDEVIGGLVRARPGLRVPGCVDGDELALRTVLGQHASLRAARTQTARLVETFGTPLEQPLGTVTHLFPAAAVLAEAEPMAFAGLGERRDALQTLAARLANGDLRIDPGSDQSEALPRLLAIRGIGPWTAAYVAM